MVIIYNTLEDGYDFNIKGRWGKDYDGRSCGLASTLCGFSISVFHKGSQRLTREATRRKNKSACFPRISNIFVGLIVRFIAS
jgi:hypothetical protein